MSAFTKFITRANTNGIRSLPFDRDFSMFDQAKMGQLPIAPGYNEEMDINDTNNITLGSYLQELSDTAKGGLSDLADKGMSLFDNNQRSNLTRAGLGALLFGFNPLTAILGAAVGKNLPSITSSFQQSKFNPLKYIQEKRAEREAAAAAKLAEARRAIAQTAASDDPGGFNYEGPAGMGFGPGRSDPTDKS